MTDFQIIILAIVGVALLAAFTPYIIRTAKRRAHFRKLEERQQAARYKRMKTALIKLGDSYVNASPEDREQMNKLVRPLVGPAVGGLLDAILPKQYVCAHRAAIITYSLNRKTGSSSEVDQQLRAILDANPRIEDFSRYQRSLGITIHHVERKKAPRSDEDGIPIGEPLE